ncbi:MAG: RNA polymerase factor sigma-54 [Gammaproteobacteria bacterium]|nr:MAG: RNA polymerase factor sigma-54 [Gammaproteobacteria bacterium]
MKPSLQLKIGQHLTMTPQLQQAIRLLQLSTLDLQQEIQQALDSNPMLEVDEQDHNNDAKTDSNDGSEASADSIKEINANNEPTASPPNEQPQSNNESNAEDGTTPDQSPIDINETQSMPDELPVDSSWEDTYQPSQSSASNAPAEDDQGFEGRNAATETLYDHLIWQFNLTPFSDLDRAIGYAIIEAIDDNGYLTVSMEDIRDSVTNEQDPDQTIEVDLDEVEAVLHRIQQFDPPGIGGVDLQSCLLIQLNQLPDDTAWLNEAKIIISDHLALLGSRDYNQIMRRTKLKEPELKAALELIQTLTPHPGASITPLEAEYIVPDVIVKKVNNRWTVELNSDASPRLRINNDYASMVKRADNSADNTYLKNNLQEAKWFIKSLVSRNETLLKVATRIVEHQRGFFEYGEEAMKPLVLHEIAEKVEMHESTISRVTTQKYMHTPKGVFELKYFFSSHVSTDSGGECSSTAIRALVKKLVAAENPKKPLSDSKIANLLKEQHIKVARRTIAKYREALSIPPSNERKRLV